MILIFSGIELGSWNEILLLLTVSAIPCTDLSAEAHQIYILDVSI